MDPAGADFAAKLRAFEHSLDAAFVAGSELGMAAVRVRIAHKLSAVVGQSFFEEVDRATSAVIAARGHSVKGHRLAEQVARRLGLQVDLYGEEAKDGDDKHRG